MLGYAKPPPTLQFFCNIKAMTVHYKTTEIFSEIKYDSYRTSMKSRVVKLLEKFGKYTKTSRY
ncbi:hypothetical protein CK516_11555 [Nostoc sp. 'Peltigera malacea cyanobiont' DB3992]|nr:hypothetical protein CK516_11555 [Nostoc sp. 'Peltigera malacea cyanobiont' DB3992]